MAFHTRNRYTPAAKVLGIISAVAGTTILISTLPQWFWLFLLGTGLISFGWYLFFRK